MVRGPLAPTAGPGGHNPVAPPCRCDNSSKLSDGTTPLNSAGGRASPGPTAGGVGVGSHRQQVRPSRCWLAVAGSGLRRRCIRQRGGWGGAMSDGNGIVVVGVGMLCDPFLAARPALMSGARRPDI